MTRQECDYRVVIDQSTSGTKLLLVTTLKEIEIVDRLDKKHQQIYPREGWVEHDPLEIMTNIYQLFAEMLKKYKLESSAIKSISITNQRETIVAWNKETGKPVSNAIVWQCKRGTSVCNELLLNGKEETVKRKTGLRLDPYFSGSKIKWLFRHYPEMKALSESGRLGIGTMDTWILWNLTQGKIYATEPSNACRTLLYDIHQNRWDEELTNLFDIPLAALADVKESKDDFGQFQGIPIVSVMADSQAALYGQGCLKTGEVKVTLGTGCSVMMQAEEQSDFVNDEIMTTIAWKEAEKTFYALEGIIRSCGDTLTWLSDDLGLFEDYELASEAAFSLPDNGGVYLIPAQLGLGAPFWQSEVKAAFVGMNRTTTKNHLIRAGFESIVYQIKAVIDAMERTSGVKIKIVKVDGGASRNQLLMQFLADSLQKSILVSNIEEMSALGTIKMSKEIVPAGQRIRMFTPRVDDSVFYDEWLNYVKKNVFFKHE